MFTGIIAGTAKVKSITQSDRGAEISLLLLLGKVLSNGLRIGDSVSVSGACLTVTKLSASGAAEFQLVAETVRRTCLGDLKPGDNVNIERSLQLGDRLEGHFVLGHVDGTGTIEQVTRSPKETTMWIRIGKRKKSLGPIVRKGSVTVDGISLTVVDIHRGMFCVSLIPHTSEVTTLGRKQRGDRVYIETDILGKYVDDRLDHQSQGAKATTE